MMDFFKEMIPTATERIWATCGAVVGSVMSYVFPIRDGYVEVLIWAMVIDYLLGWFAAYVNPGLKLDSKRGTIGMTKKVLILALVAFSMKLALFLDMRIIYTATASGYLAIECLSIIENAGKAGMPVPDKLKSSLAQLAEEKIRIKK